MTRICDCRCVLHAVFAQQSYTSQRPGNKLAMIARKVSWSLPSRAAARVRPSADRASTPGQSTVSSLMSVVVWIR